MNTVSGPYQINKDDIERSSTLERSDLNQWYILVTGTYQFVNDKQAGHKLIDYLRE